MPYFHADNRFPYRGLYVGVGEIAVLAGTSKQYVGAATRGLRTFPWFPEPVGYLQPALQRTPYWFQRDIVEVLRGEGRLRGELPSGPGAAPIEDWEYDYQGALLTCSFVVPLLGVTDGSLHRLARKPGFAPYAEALYAGIVWRETQIREMAA
jgi:hypothetical protein